MTFINTDDEGPCGNEDCRKLTTHFNQAKQERFCSVECEDRDDEEYQHLWDYLNDNPEEQELFLSFEEWDGVL